MANTTKFNLWLTITMLVSLLLGYFIFNKPSPVKQMARPNFLLVITDDQSWAYTGYAGYPAVKTPNFDRIANEGIYFDNAYASAPTCTASRSALLTGQHFWRLGSAGQLWGEFPVTLTTYQQILEKHGYKVG
ncbi:MAG TPA: sulfatase-like hydrolase/transferase, partial [Pseudomonadales bacterium]|nr:sulfatase-like hydrolase/transferase [Pseudomonadales bacterium]